MSESSMSKGFARFAKQTTTGSYDEARKTERQARGIALEVGTKGVGVVTVVGDVETNRDGDTYPYIEATISVLTPEGASGMKLKDPLNLKQRIRKTDNREEEEAFSAALQMLEQLGCPSELTSGYEDMQELFDWFAAEPRKVSFEINDGGTYQGRPQKRVVAFAYIEGGSQPSADEGESEGFDFPEGTKFCTYRGVRYGILEELEDDLLMIKNCNTGADRKVAVSSVEMEG